MNTNEPDSTDASPRDEDIVQSLLAANDHECCQGDCHFCEEKIKCSRKTHHHGNCLCEAHVRSTYSDSTETE